MMKKMYNNLAWLWPIISPKEEYIEESIFFSEMIKNHAQIPVQELLHLGCGGGGNDFTLKKYFKVTGVDISPEMLKIAREINPEVEYQTGDMRTIRLNKKFDAVACLDSIAYMLCEKDLRLIYRTAFDHLKPGGIFLTFIEYNPQSFPQNRTTVDTKSQNDVEVTFIENNYDRDPEDTTFEAYFIFLVREKGKLSVFTDRHIVGLFPLETWIHHLGSAGFSIVNFQFTHSSFRDGEFLPGLIGIKPG